MLEAAQVFPVDMLEYTTAVEVVVVAVQDNAELIQKQGMEE